MFTKGGGGLCIKSRTWDQGKRSLFTVEGCSPKRSRAISSMVKYMGKIGPGKSVHYEEVFTNQECSLREVSLYWIVLLLCWHRSHPTS